MSYSYSCLSKFLECPYSYEQEYILKKQAPKTIPLLKGSAIHKSLEEAAKNTGSISDMKNYLFDREPGLFRVAEWLQESGVHKIEGIEWKLVNEAYNFVGVIDRVDIVEGGKRRILDYKTGKNRGGLVPHERQLYCYVWLVESVKNLKVDEIGIYYVDSDEAYIEQVDYKKVEEAINWIGSTTNIINNTKTYNRCNKSICYWCNHSKMI